MRLDPVRISNFVTAVGYMTTSWPKRPRVFTAISTHGLRSLSRLK